MRARDLVDLFRDLFRVSISEWLEDEAPTMAAAVAYYAVFSLSPLLIILIVLAGIFYGREAVAGSIVYNLQGLVGRDMAGVIEDVIRQAADPASSYSASLIGSVLLLVGASGLFVQVRMSLNNIWGIESPKGGGIRGIARSYAMALVLIAVVGLVILASIFLTALLGPAGTYVQGALPFQIGLLRISSLLMSFLLVTALFAATYRTLVAVVLEWDDLLIGSAVASLLFAVGNQILEVYMRYSNTGSVYGAAGSLVVFLLWIYYTALIFFFGAELIKVYARRHGSLKGEGTEAHLKTA